MSDAPGLYANRPTTPRQKGSQIFGQNTLAGMADEIIRERALRWTGSKPPLDRVRKNHISALFRT